MSSVGRPSTAGFRGVCGTPFPCSTAGRCPSFGRSCLRLSLAGCLGRLSDPLLAALAPVDPPPVHAEREGLGSAELTNTGLLDLVRLRLSRVPSPRRRPRLSERLRGLRTALCVPVESLSLDPRSVLRLRRLRADLSVAEDLPRRLVGLRGLRRSAFPRAGGVTRCRASAFAPASRPT